MSENSIQEAIADKKTFWQRHMDARREAKVSRVQYCRQRGLSVSLMAYWEAKFLRSSVPAKMGSETRFASVRLIDPSLARARSESIDPVWLARFLRALMAS